MGGSGETASPSAARHAAACAMPLANAGPSAAQVHGSQPGRVARCRCSEETYGTAQSRRTSA